MFKRYELTIHSDDGIPETVEDIEENHVPFNTFLTWLIHETLINSGVDCAITVTEQET